LSDVRNSWLVVELLDPCVRGISRHLLHPEMAIGDARDLREVGDGQDLSALR